MSTATATRNGYAGAALPAMIEQAVTTLGTAEALERAVLAAGLAVGEIEKLLMESIAARAQAMVDAACAEIDKARAAAERIAGPGYTGDEALGEIERCRTRAAGYEREAKRRQKEYLKLQDKYGPR